MRKQPTRPVPGALGVVGLPGHRGDSSAQLTAFWSVARLLGLFAIFAYAAMVIEPAVGHFYSAPPFFLTWEFFGSFPRWPGGFLCYLATFLDSYSCHNLPGAAVFTALCALLMLASQRMFRLFTGVPARLPPLILPLLLLVVRQQPASPATILGLGLLAAFACASACVVLPISSNGFRVVIGACFAATLSYVAGPWPGLLFCLLLAASSLAGKSSWSLPLAAFPGAVLVVCLFLFAWDSHPTPWLQPPGGIYGIVVFFSVPTLALASIFGNRFVPATPTGIRGTGTGSSPGAWLRPIGALVVLGTVCGGLLWGSLDRSYQARAQICYFSHRGSHEQVVAAARVLPLLDPSSEIRLHLALYHLGRLNEDLFGFDNCRMPTVLPGLSEGVGACRAQSETIFELGQVGVAEHFAHEALEWDGNRPDILLMLANVNVLKGRPRAAKVFLRVLSQIPGERSSALSYLESLEAGIPADSPQMVEVRTRMPQTDLPHDYLAPEPLLRQLLHSNSGNRMAFEYLMMHYLLNLDLDGFAAHLPLMQKHDYREVPKHFEEAALLYEKLRGKSPDLGGRSIRPESQGRFKEITAALARGEDKTPAGRRALKIAFGDTYWLYYVMNRSTKNSGQP